MKDVKAIDITTSFPRLTYQEAMAAIWFGEPDTRLAWKLLMPLRL